ncbi:MAG: F0F1 ATP synthase subunit delta [Desulfobulbus sp.]|nr:F0F1 ATP synthase subunit delta [Desulfobulbus sp.]
MTIDPFTFALEIVNFLVLLWLLHRFLYRPIQQAIADRKQVLNQEMMRATQREEEAGVLKAQYERSLANWEEERARKQDELRQTLAKEEERALDKERQAAASERVRLQTLAKQDYANQQRQAQAQAAQAALHLTGKMLKRLAGRELDQAILHILLEDLAQLPAAERNVLQRAFARRHEAVAVVSAREISPEQQQKLQEHLARVLESDIDCIFTLDSALLSGYRLAIGDQLLHVNLSDELAFFSKSLSHEAA